MSTINPDKPITYTYQAAPEVKQEGIFSKIMGPLRKVIGSSFGKELGKIRLSKQEKNELHTKKEAFLANDHVKSLNIEMKDRKGKKTHNLDGILIKNKSLIEPGKDQKYVLVFFGMGDCYEKHLDAMDKLAQDTQANIVSFNYRGKGDSSGSASSAKDYIEDGKALVAYLQQSEAAKQENILLYGHSLGGGVAAKVSQELEHKSPIISESSFSTFKSAVKNKKGTFTSWIMKKVGWNINSTKALENMDQAKLGIVVNRRDPTVHYEEAALYKEFKNKGVDKEFHTVKIGRKPLKEELEASNVKVGKKSFKKNEGAKAKNVANDDSYKIIQKNIKEAGWIKFLRHPHQMIMDQPLASELAIPDQIKEELGQLKAKAEGNEKFKGTYQAKENLANELLALNQKYAQEDKVAYEGIVTMIKTMLDN